LTILHLKAFTSFFHPIYEFDTIVYHLPFIANWLSTGSLFDIYYSAFASPLGNYPSNFELINFFYVLPFKSDYLVALINFPLFFVLFLSFKELLIEIGIKKKFASIFALAPFFMPVFLLQSSALLVDLFFSITFILGVLFFLIHIKTKSNYYLILSGLSLGIFIGTKYLGLLYGLVIFLFFILFFIFRKIINKETLINKTLTLGLSTFLTGSFFYIRNIITNLNPVFPLNVDFLGFNIFKGFIGTNEKVASTSLIENISSWDQFQNFLHIFSLMTGKLGSILIFTPFITLIFAIIFLFKNKKIAFKLLLITILSFIYFILYFKAPFSFIHMVPNIRYSTIFILISLTGLLLLISQIGSSYFQSKFKIKSSGFVTLIVITFISFFYFHSLINNIIFPDILLRKSETFFINFSFIKENANLFFIFTVAVFLFFTFIFSIKKLKYFSIIPLIISVFLFSIIFKTGIESRYANFKQFYSNIYNGEQSLLDVLDASLWINENTDFNKIAYTGLTVTHYLYGPKLDREVDYVNINECTNCKYFDYKDSKDSIRRDPDQIFFSMNKFLSK